MIEEKLNFPGNTQSIFGKITKNTSKGDTNMMAFDVDTVAFLQTQTTALIAQATHAQVAPGQGLVRIDKTLWSGGTVEQDGGAFAGSEIGQGRIFQPAREVVFLLKSSGWLASNGINTSNPKADASIEIQPKHGVLESLPDGEFRYTPHKGFLGEDFMSFIVNIEGKTVRLNLPIWVVKEIEEPKAQNTTPSPAQWTAGGTLFDWFQQSSLSALLAEASAIPRTFQALPGTTLGLTQGSGPSATSHRTGHA